MKQTNQSQPNIQQTHAISPAHSANEAEFPGQTLAQKQHPSNEAFQHQRNHQRTERNSCLLEKLVKADTDLLEAEERLERARLRKSGLDEAVIVLEKARSKKDKLVAWTQVLAVEVKISLAFTVIQSNRDFY